MGGRIGSGADNQTIVAGALRPPHRLYAGGCVPSRHRAGFDAMFLKGGHQPGTYAGEDGAVRGSAIGTLTSGAAMHGHLSARVLGQGAACPRKSGNRFQAELGSGAMRMFPQLVGSGRHGAAGHFCGQGEKNGHADI